MRRTGRALDLAAQPVTIGRAGMTTQRSVAAQHEHRQGAYLTQGGGATNARRGLFLSAWSREGDTFAAPAHSRYPEWLSKLFTASASVSKVSKMVTRRVIDSRS